MENTEIHIAKMKNTLHGINRHYTSRSGNLKTDIVIGSNLKWNTEGKKP